MEDKEILEEIKRLKQEIEELKGQLIDFELPKNYDQMSDEEKTAYQQKQKNLKKAALANMDNYSVIVNDYTVAKYPKNKNLVKKFAKEVGNLSSVSLERGMFTRTVSDKTKEQHRKNLEAIDSLIDRFNSTKAIRNDKIEFGANFNNFIETYLSKLAAKNLDRAANKEFLKKNSRQKDKNGDAISEEFKFQNLTEDQRKDLIKIRIKLFAEKLNRLQVVAAKKVKRDSRQNMSTYLEKHGFKNNQVEFRNGTKKFTTVKSVVSSYGVDMSKIQKKRKSEIKHDVTSPEKKYEKAQHEIIELNIQKEKFDSFVRNYRGNGRQFYVEFQQNFPKIAEKLYNQKTKSSALSFKSQNLMSSPVSVQEHEIEKQFTEEFRKNNNRLRYSSYFIPASEAVAGYFLGKRLTNEKTETEKELDAMKMKEYQKEIKNIEMREELVGFETMFESLNEGIKQEFEKKVINRNKKFGELSDTAKKIELKKFLNDSIAKFEEKVRRNKFFSVRTEKLEKLNGVLISKDEKLTHQNAKSFLDALSQQDAETYKHLMKEVKELSSRLETEKDKIKNIETQLDKIPDDSLSYEDSVKMQGLIDELDSHNKKLAVVQSLYDEAEKRKKEFETNFASVQIEKAAKSQQSKIVSFNTAASVLDKYSFPAVDAFGEVYEIEKGTIEGKQVEKITSAFIMNFKNQIQNMKLSFAESKIPEITDYLARLEERSTDDFGTNIRDIKKTEKFFADLLKKENIDKDLKVELEKYLQRLDKVETDLIKKLKAMNVEIGNVTLAKNKK